MCYQLKDCTNRYAINYKRVDVIKEELQEQLVFPHRVIGCHILLSISCDVPFAWHCNNSSHMKVTPQSINNFYILY